MSLAEKISAVVAAIGAELKTKADADDLATVATSGKYGDLSERPTLGSAAAADTADFATAAQGGRADTAVQGDDPRLTDARTPKPHTHPTSDVTGLDAALATKLDQTAVDARVAIGTAALVDQAPATLDTLNELAAALGNDPNFATTVANQIGTKADAARKVNGHPLTADVTVTKADVGLGNVDNTADANKSVASAAKLTTAVGFRTALNSTSVINFDGTVPVTPGVQGTLPIANGGTGATTAAAARSALGVSYGTAAGTVCQGNDARLSDQRTPTDGSVTNAKVAADAAIALSKLATGNVVGSKSGTAADLTVWVGPQASVPTSRDANTVYLWY